MLPPRLDADEIEYLEQFMLNKNPDSKMVEWGSGGSTLMLLRYFSRGKLTSIEHNREWYDKVVTELMSGDYPDECVRNIVYLWEPPTVEGAKLDVKFYKYATPFEENPCFARDYIDPETTEYQIFDADIYFVDGICRNAVLANIQKKAINRNAVVFLHDYYGREDWYAWGVGLYSRIEKVGSTLARLYL